MSVEPISKPPARKETGVGITTGLKTVRVQLTSVYPLVTIKQIVVVRSSDISGGRVHTTSTGRFAPSLASAGANTLSVK
jgi:hypothetical protein